ncbi:MAG: cupin domain-containing protein, partial [bacterium]|nr:cupin domain-containing protein [bacterium]
RLLSSGSDVIFYANVRGLIFLSRESTIWYSVFRYIRNWSGLGQGGIMKTFWCVICIVMLKGELTVVTEEKKVLHLKAGDSIAEVVNTWHYGKNEGTEAAVIIVFYAGIKGKPITVKHKGRIHGGAPKPYQK